MICKNCGNECIGNESFCGNCGSPIVKEAPKKSKGPLIAGIIAACVAALGLLVVAVVVIVVLVVVIPKDKADSVVTNNPVQEGADNPGYAGGANEVSEVAGSTEIIPLAHKDIFSGNGTKLVATEAANAPSYSVSGDLSNVTNIDRYYLSDRERQLLAENDFFVVGNWGSNEFFSQYESNRYWQLPNFVTVDSLMNSYHLYFSYLLKTTEKEHLSYALSDLSKIMLAESEAQYNSLIGTEWEESARRNMAFFAVGAYLQDSSVNIPAAVQGEAETEISRIFTASGMDTSVISGAPEDYTQYIPRGYYEGDPQLEAYFRTMMWYGRMPFLQQDEVSDRSAVLMTIALRDAGLDEWETIYGVTSFFAGASDDETYYEYLPVIDHVYGANAGVGELVGDADKWNEFHSLTSTLKPPAINSFAGGRDDDGNIQLSYRFMGQRFSIDAAIMQRLVANAVPGRNLPDVLDVAGALGSDTACSILEQQGDWAMENYADNMAELRLNCENSSDELWNASLYSGWLHTLTPLLEKKGEGYPSYMQTDAWTKKNLETFAGSYTELKHDTVLYSKQILAEGDGEDPTQYDDRGYVDPQSEVYARFANLARSTYSGLEQLNMISAKDVQSLEELAVVAETLFVISEKELANAPLTDAEYDYIRNYGKTIEHFWRDAMAGITGETGHIEADEYPCALVVDVASSAAGECLEMATGKAQTVYVVVPVDGSLRIASGTVYSFYQFPWSSADRLTDSKWRQMCGAAVNDEGWYSMDPSLQKPAWTDEYRSYDR